MKKFIKFSRIRVINLIIFIIAFTLTEIGRYVYRPYIYQNGINDFAIADTMGNHLGVITIIFFTLFVSHAGKRDGLIMIAVIGPGLIIYEFLQEYIIGSTSDWKDVIATIIGGIVALLIYILIMRKPRSSCV